MQNVISCIGHNNQVEHHDQKKENSTHFKFFHNSLLLTCLHVHACYMSTRSGTRCFTNSKKYTFVQEIGLKLICFWGKWTKNVINQFQTCHRRKFWRFPVHWLEGESTTHTDCMASSYASGDVTRAVLGESLTCPLMCWTSRNARNTHKRANWS